APRSSWRGRNGHSTHLARPGSPIKAARVACETRARLHAVDSRLQMGENPARGGDSARLSMKKPVGKEVPFFARYLIGQQLGKVTAGGGIVTTMKYPSDAEDGGPITLKYPSDDAEYVTLKYPSDDDEALPTE